MYGRFPGHEGHRQARRLGVFKEQAESEGGAGGREKRSRDKVSPVRRTLEGIAPKHRNPGGETHRASRRNHFGHEWHGSFRQHQGGAFRVRHSGGNGRFQADTRKAQDARQDG